MRTIYFLIALVGLLIGLVLFVNVDKAHAGGPWSEQYCDVEITQIRVIDQQGNVVDNLTEEKVVCKDGASDFLFDMGIAESCGMYTWDMPVGEVIITQRQIACKKMDGTGYEIVQGYHGID
ncbi:MAG: hypothetical protein CBC01_01700 [Betaproteobacteria bacterium TMED41]|nr:MAG: hypothetical protein CBC01_01700 [Betaproteobacteria bacterium TMED41]|tara:strand:- start:1683 stop:2045 length:363 start_codon:yes stop_codon:yes gene_type:complete